MPPPDATTLSRIRSAAMSRVGLPLAYSSKNPKNDLGLVWINVALARLAAATVAEGQAAGDQSVADAAIEGALHRDAQTLDELRVDDAADADMNFGDFAVRVYDLDVVGLEPLVDRRHVRLIARQ